MKYLSLIAAAIVFLAPAPSIGQTTRPQPVASQMALPAGSDSWVVEVFKSGGIFGKSGRDFALSSEGQILCDLPEASCPKSFVPARFQPLLQDIQLGTVTIASRSLYCNDCLTTTLVIRRRDAAGVQQTTIASWDDVTRSSAPREVIRLYEALIALRN